MNDFTKALEFSKAEAHTDVYRRSEEEILQARAKSYRAMGELQKAQADEVEAQRLAAQKKGN